MATIDLPPSSGLELSAGIEPVKSLQPEDLQLVGVDLNSEQYLYAIRGLIDQEVVISTVTERFISPLNFVLRYAIGPITVDRLQTRIVGVVDQRNQREVHFHYHYDKLGLDRPVRAIAPADRAITKIFVSNETL